MRPALAICGLLGACSFSTNVTGGDASVDVPHDQMIDADERGRVTTGLIGLWSFEGAAPLTDTSGFPAGNQQPIDLTSTGTVAVSNGTVVTASADAKLESTPNPRLNADCVNGGGVTLEVWVSPTMPTQGSLSSLRVVAGLTSSINSRNVSLFQAGDQWLARVRTNSDVNGAPNLLPASSEKVVATMTHLVVVADADERILYVNGEPQAIDPNPGPLTGWDFSYRLVLGNEFQQSRPWAGTFELVALYRRALGPAEVQRNFLAGPQP